MTKLYSSKEDFQSFTETLISLLKSFKSNSADVNTVLLAILSNLITQQYNRNVLIENDVLWSTLLNILVSFSTTKKKSPFYSFFI
jgi:hypothetical protein